MAEANDIPSDGQGYPRYPIIVMLVDDQSFVAEAIRQQLEGDREINFHYCSNPDQAIPTALEIRPTVILLDLMMPDVDGLALLRYFRANPQIRDVPVIVLSSRGEATVKADAFDAGANDYLIKLPDRIEMLARIRYHSNAYIMKLQRDEAYRALRESQKKLADTNLELLRLVNFDGLTGLANRRHFDESLHIEWKRAARNNLPLSVMMLDIDYFKLYNDSYGHLKGDEVLRKVAAIIQKSAMRPADQASRYGGEEFVVILPETPASGASLLAEEIRRNVEALNIPHQGSDIASCVTISIGLASAVPTGDSPLSLVNLADAALYQAKESGRNRVVVSES
ncbi:MAG: diguanylate cyclase [Sulfuricella sp.]|nr:diguanylate cyclase [Sulfuricella sp.]